MFNKKQKAFIQAIEAKYGKNALIGRQEILDIKAETGLGYPTWLVNDYKVARGEFRVPSIDDVSKPSAIIDMKAVEDEEIIEIPEVDPNYIKFGFFKDIYTIIESEEFFPVNIVGEHGSGKTQLVTQACALLKRGMIRVNVNKEIDENALVGGPTLENGNIVFKEGPVLKCMRSGSILLIDEMDRGSVSAYFSLFSILEGGVYYNKHTGETVKPKKGFNIIATCNTKGYGCTSKYISQILDEAFLERFNITIEQQYPTFKIEKEILSRYCSDSQFVETLCKWSNVIRESFYQNAIDSLISTRRLIQIVKTYNIFKSKDKALEYCVNRFEEEEKLAFLDLYNKIQNPDSNESMVTEN